MTLRFSKPVTSGTRHRTDLDLKAVLTASSPEKSLLVKGLYKRQGRNHTGKITVRHRGGGVKRKMRVINWTRDKSDVPR